MPLKLLLDITCHILYIFWCETICREIITEHEKEITNTKDTLVRDAGVSFLQASHVQTA